MQLQNPPAPVRSRAGRLISIVAPCFNEESVLGHFFQRMEAVLQAVGTDYEIVCVNDGSRDSTLAVLLARRAENERIKVIDLARNFGKDIALSAGLDAARGDMVVPIDVDLQDPPELIETFVQAWERGADVAVGVREDRGSDSFLKRFTAESFYKIFNMMAETPLVHNAGDYRLLDRRVVDVLKQLPERRRFMKGLFTWVGFKQELIPYARAPRAAGTSSWRYWRLWNFALDGITSFSTGILRVWTYVGAAAALSALAYGAYIVVRTLVLGTDVPGYPSLMAALLFSFGFQMVAIGVLGEYVARIYEEVKGRPLYVVMDRFGLDEPAPRG